MKTKLISASIALICAPAYGVNLNFEGIGEVLIYPYYTTQDGRRTLVSIVNTTGQVKIVKVRFLEAMNSRDVLDFHLFLSPFDVWVAAVQEDPTPCGGNFGEAEPPCSDEKTPANIFTPDSSCTFGDISSFGIDGKDFVNFDYSGDRFDSGPVDLGRTREGHIIAIEMGILDDTIPAAAAIAEAVTHDGEAGQVDCQTVEDAYLGPLGDPEKPSGLWNPFARGDVENGVGEPTGGLYGSWEILRVSDGRAVGGAAVALEHFYDPQGAGQASDRSLHFFPGQQQPNLNDGDQGFGRHIARVVHQAPDGPMTLQAEFEESVDAVSAVLARSRLYGEWTINPGVAAATDWVITFPTKAFYTGLRPTAGFGTLAPFTTGAFDGGQACEEILSHHWDRNERLGREVDAGFSPPLPPGQRFELCWEANVVTVGSEDSVLGSVLVSEPYPVSAAFRNGHIALELARARDESGFAPWTRFLDSTRPIGGTLARFYGLPVVGFAVVRRLNANVGIGATYSSSFGHRFERCIQSGALAPAGDQPLPIPDGCQ